MPRNEAVIAALRERGAAAMDHPGGTLLDHLLRTSELLRSWGAQRDVVLAGLAHAAYGTDGFATALFGLDERDVVSQLIGHTAEGLVYLYACCDRAATYPTVTAGTGLLRDRFTGSVMTLTEGELCAFVELTVANELDVVRHNARLLVQHGNALRTLFEGWRDQISGAAHDECGLVLGGDEDEPARRHVVIDGTRIHYLEWGAPGHPVIVFLHGGGLNAHTWDRVCAALRDTHRCIAIDLRGHGESEWSPTLDYSVGVHARDLLGLIGRLELERPIVVGHSLGGFAALELATWCTTSLAGLVVVDVTPFSGEGPTLRKVRAFVEGARTFDTFDDALDHALAFNNGRRDRNRTRATLRHSLRQLTDGRWTWKRDDRHLGDGYIAATIVAARALAPVAASIECPTLIVRGEHSLGQDVAQRFCDLLRNGQCATVAGAGHNVQSDNPTGLVEALLPFVTRAASELPDPPAS